MGLTARQNENPAPGADLRLAIELTALPVPYSATISSKAPKGTQYVIKLGGVYCLSHGTPSPEMLGAVLKSAEQDNNWGAHSVCLAYFRKAPYDMGQVGFHENPASNPVRIPTPVAPVISHKPSAISIAGTSPGKPLYLPFGQGRLLLWKKCGQVHHGYFVRRNDKTLETDPSKRGFDSLTFWMSVFGLPASSTWKIANGEALAQMLCPSLPKPVPALGSLEEITNAFGFQGSSCGWPWAGWHGPCVLWQSNRIVICNSGDDGARAFEFGPAGFVGKSLSAFRSSNSLKENWNVRRLFPPRSDYSETVV